MNIPGASRSIYQRVKAAIPVAVKDRIKALVRRRKPVSPRNSDFIPHMQKRIRPDVVTVLDVGCGKLWDDNPPSEDYLLTIFSSPRYKVTGIDAFPECVEWRRRNGPQGEYICMNALEIGGLRRRFDLVIAHHVIEHFDKDTATRLLETIESLADRQVIIGAPEGFTDTRYAVKLHGNPFEEHKSAWTSAEFRKRGYSLIRSYAGAFVVEKRLQVRGEPACP